MTFLIRLRRILFYAAFWIAFIYSGWVIFFKYAPDFTKINIIWAGAISGMLALFFSALKIHEIALKDINTDKKTKDLLYGAANIFFKNTYLILTPLLIVAFICILKFINSDSAVCFITGAIVSMVSLYISALIIKKSAKSTSNVSKNSYKETFNVAFDGALASSLIIIGLSLMMITFLYFWYKDPNIISIYALGCIFSALFINISKLIYNNNLTANTASKTDNRVSFNADFLSLFVLLIAGSMALGSLCLDLMGTFIPLCIASTGILCSIISSLIIKTNEKINPLVSMHLGNAAGIILYLVINYYLLGVVFMPDYKGIYLTVAIGGVIGYIFGLLTNIINDKDKIEENKTKSRYAFLVLFLSAVISVVSFIVISGMSSYNAGAFGISLTAIGIISNSAVILAFNSFNCISKISKNILSSIETDQTAKERIEKSVLKGEKICLYAKGTAIISSLLAAFILTIVFGLTVNVEDLDILNPFVCMGIVLGASIPFLLTGTLIKASYIKKSENAENSKDGIEDTKTASILFALKAVIPFLFVIALVLIVIGGTYKLFGKILLSQTMGGFLTGAIISGICLSFMKINSIKSDLLNVFVKFMPALIFICSGVFILK